MTLTNHEIALALDALAPIALKLDNQFKWYVSHGVRIQDKHTQRSTAGRGDHPDEALVAHWQELTGIKAEEYLVTDDGRRVRWNGFMWRDVPKPVEFRAGAHS